MAGDIPHPRCATCGERIGVYEPVWRRHANGTLVSTSLLNLGREDRSDPDQTFFHLGCLAPDEIPQDQTG